MNNTRHVLILLILLHGLTACGISPWVKPYERQALADPLMSMDNTPAASPFKQHMLHSREAARGGEIGGGGGCGCN
ncbi:MAG: DUF4266 domain-containing protein [Pseudomonadales bacterium]|nr:DUF4266 domain-containing protein [Pseudomonadales bacterium]